MAVSQKQDMEALTTLAVSVTSKTAKTGYSKSEENKIIVQHTAILEDAEHKGTTIYKWKRV